MEDNKIAIIKYNNKNNSLLILKNKKGIIIRDGILNFAINCEPLSCPCSKTLLCNHTIFLLNTYFNLDFTVITFIHKILPQFYQNINNSNISNILSEIVYKDILSDECGICVDKLIKNENIKDELIECNICKKYCHKKCFKKWLDSNKKTKINKKCVYCNSEI